MAEGQSVKGVGLRGLRMSLPHQLVHPCLFGGRLLTPTGWVGGPGSLSLLFSVPLSLRKAQDSSGLQSSGSFISSSFLGVRLRVTFAQYT